MTETQNKPYSLPEGWTWATIGEISERIHYGYTAKSSKETIGPKMLRITDIQDRAVNWDSVPYCRIDEEKKPNYLLKDGDLVFARTGATVGKSFLIKGATPEAVFASYLIRVIFPPQIRKKFVYYFFQSPSYWLQIFEGKVGIGQPNVNATKLSKLSIPLSPFPEQGRIVSKLEELFTRLDAGVESLRNVKAQLQLYRQAVLKHAFNGKLTEEWRKTHKDAIEPVTNFKTSLKITEIPENWIFTTIENVCVKITDGSHYTPKYVKKGYPFITISDLNGERIDFSSAKSISKTEYEKLKGNCNPHAGDVLFSKDGTIGKVVKIDSEKEFIVLSSLAIVRPNPKYLNQNYLRYLIQSQYFLRQCGRLRTGTALTRIILRNLRKVVIPIPPLEEQHRIAEEIDSKFSIAIEVEKVVKQNLSQSVKLRQSLLRTAFAGRLVAQDPSDEPADRLLERIRREKEQRNNSKKKNSRRKSSKRNQRRLNSYVE